jgi:predicted P-loop ATPase/GTPase
VQIAAATEPTPGQVNEDFVITGPTWALVLDGATTRPDIDTGCIHDVPWFVRHLAIEFALLLTRSPDRALDHTLADAIAATRRLHEATAT